MEKSERIAEDAVRHQPGAILTCLCDFGATRTLDPYFGDFQMSNVTSDLDRIEGCIDERSNLASSLQELRAIARRVDELTDRILSLYSFPDFEIQEVEESFDWPTTAILPSQKALHGDHFEYQEGVLRFLGYRVGFSGLSKRRRRAVLRYAYGGQLPQVGSEDYMLEWGSPSTGARLKKMAHSIAAFARNGKRNERQDMSKAVDHWVADLAWLKSDYYDGRYDGQFQWPDT